MSINISYLTIKISLKYWWITPMCSERHIHQNYGYVWKYWGPNPVCVSFVSQMRSMGLIEWLKVNRIRFERINESRLGYCLVTGCKEVVHCSFSIDGAVVFTCLAYLHLATRMSSYSCKSISVALQIIFFSLKHKALQSKQNHPDFLEPFMYNEYI